MELKKFKQSKYDKDWSYRLQGNTIIAINNNPNAIIAGKTIVYTSAKEARKEFHKRTSNPVGRPTERQRTVTTKKSII